MTAATIEVGILCVSAWTAGFLNSISATLTPKGMLIMRELIVTVAELFGLKKLLSALTMGW